LSVGGRGGFARSAQKDDAKHARPIPVLVMGRLAIDQQYQKKGLGKALLLDASRRTIQAGNIAGVAALLVHALSEEARRFYLSRGFLESPVQPMTLFMRLADAREILVSL